MNQLTALTAGPQAVQQTESTSLLAVIERAARDPAVDVEKLERLMLMRERLEQQQSRKSFNAAMARAKSEIGPIFKNKAVDFTSTRGRTNYKYEDLAEIARTIDPVLAKYGLSYRYRAEQNGVKLRVTCVVSHEDGWFEETSLEGENDSSGNKNPIQGVGSTATFLQRYTLKMSFGLAASVDDDGRGGVIDDHKSPELPEHVRDYIDGAIGTMAAIETPMALADWWAGEKHVRVGLDLVKRTTGPSPGYAELFAAYAARGKELSK